MARLAGNRVDRLAVPGELGLLLLEVDRRAGGVEHVKRNADVSIGKGTEPLLIFGGAHGYPLRPASSSAVS